MHGNQIQGDTMTDQPAAETLESYLLDYWESIASGMLKKRGRHRVLRRIDEHQLHETVSYARRPTAPVNTVNLVVVDTETTGLDPDHDEVVEIAARPVTIVEPLDPKDSCPAALASHQQPAFVGRREPGVPMSEGAAKVTGISTEALAGQAIDEAALRKVFDGVDLVVAHNARFDRAMCINLWPWMADLDWACSDRDIGWRDFGAHSHNLQALANWQGFYFEGAHGAEADVQALLHTLAVPVLTGEPPETPFDPHPTTTGFAELLRSWNAGTVRVFAWGSPFHTKDRLRLRGYRWDPGYRVWFRDMLGPAPSDDAPLGTEMQAEAEWLAAECSVTAPEFRGLSNQERWA
ncbi:exonuclease domain-containing protein [Marinibaculum pumilum]|uniref:Exonuclease domain-containing protein n=1 Tax=Marinibaculum pumilum TaxID=1766165 RepID=A0ABV7KZ19_9PROT